MKPTTFHPDAEAEVVDAAKYYEDRSIGLGSELLDEVEAALGQISSNPALCQQVGRRTRRKTLWRFPYNLIYADDPDRIRIVAFAHQKRRPFYWGKRLKDAAEPEGPIGSGGPRRRGPTAWRWWRSLRRCSWRPRGGCSRHELKYVQEASVVSESLVVPLALGDDGPAPRGWRWVLLTDVARLETGHTPSRNHPEWWGGDIPWIALPDIRALHGREAMQTSEYTNEAGIENSSARVLPAGTVVLSRTASVGFVTVMGRPMATSQDFVNWVCGPDLEPWFLTHLLIAAQDYIRSLSSGAVHKTVYMPTAKAFHVCIPPRSLQERIVVDLRHKLSLAEKSKKLAEELASAIQKLPAALLRQAFRGEL